MTYLWHFHCNHVKQNIDNDQVVPSRKCLLSQGSGGKVRRLQLNGWMLTLTLRGGKKAATKEQNSLAASLRACSSFSWSEYSHCASATAAGTQRPYNTEIEYSTGWFLSALFYLSHWIIRHTEHFTWESRAWWMAVRGRVTCWIYQTGRSTHTSEQPSAPWTEAFRAGLSVKDKGSENMTLCAPQVMLRSGTLRNRQISAPNEDMQVHTCTLI